jgi:predicted AlkP superfamily pyrophosphatase or phosphodiesterase
MQRFICLIVIALLLPLPARADDRPVPQIRKALLISIDGLRPDVLLRGDAPNIRQLMQRGSFTLWARSTYLSFTLPTHVSMVTGVLPELHGIVWNTVLPTTQPAYPKKPTLFELAHKAGLTTACITGKAKFGVLNKPGTIDYTLFPEESYTNSNVVTSTALQVLREHKPDVMFVHIPDVDVVGHAKGWGSPEQVAAVAVADACVGRILDALAQEKLTDSTVVILTADHGGSGRTHGPEDARSRHIPWIVAGPGIRQNYDLTLNRDLDVQVYDTFTTLCKLLDLKIPGPVTGKFVPDILAQRELLNADAR